MRSSKESKHIRMSDILERIYRAKAAAQIEDEKAQPYAALLERGLARRAGRRHFARAIAAAQGPAVIAEVKRASPSAGLIARDFDPAVIAATYESAGADCISVLTESDHFLGHLDYLDVVRERATLPILRKDFLRTRYEVAQSAAAGADAILLIAAGCTDEQLLELIDEAALFDLDVLLEVHDALELQRALQVEVALIGINNRNLRTFETDLAISEYLLPQIPREVTVISESGVREPGDVLRLVRAGARGVLIGESLMRAQSPRAFIGELKSAYAGSAR